MKKVILLTILTVLSSVSFAQTSTTPPTPSTGNSTLDNAMNQAKNQSGSFNSMASNPFSFCSGPKPSKHDPMRKVWDQICPAGNAQAAAAPVPVPSGTSLPDTSSLKNQFNQTNGSK